MTKGKCVYYRNCTGCIMIKKCKYVRADHHECIHNGIIKNRSLLSELIGLVNYGVPNRPFI